MVPWSLFLGCCKLDGGFAVWGSNLWGPCHVGSHRAIHGGAQIGCDVLTRTQLCLERWPLPWSQLDWKIPFSSAFGVLSGENH